MQRNSGIHLALSILCFIVNYFPELVVPAGVLALYSTGRLSSTIGEGAAMTVVKVLIPICIAAAIVLSVLMAVFAWNHYEETVSRGLRRWISNVKFFQNRLGFTVATLFETILINFFLTYSVAALLMSIFT